MNAPIRVLLIEDEPADARLVQIALRDALGVSFDVTWATTLDDARRRLQQQAFEIVLLDLSLPDSAGLDTLHNIKPIAHGAEIIVLTGLSDIEFALNTLYAGCADYLVKNDFSADSLVRTIRYSLQRAELNARNRLLIAALEAAANGIIITDASGHIEWANPSFCELTGYELIEVLGRQPAELIQSGQQDQAFYEAMWQAILSGKTWRGEIVNCRKNGELYYEELSIAPVRYETGEIRHFIGIKEDISERKRLEAQLQKLARTDPLTELYNRRVFLEHLNIEATRLTRQDALTTALLMLDLDHFKRINDNYGHAAGDQTLCHFADLIRATLRTTDISARLGGEEFAILLPGAAQADAMIIAERLRKQVETAAIPHGNGPIRYTVSIGCTSLRAFDATRTDQALHRADIALYQAKAAGRNRTCWHDG